MRCRSCLSMPHSQGGGSYPAGPLSWPFWLRSASQRGIASKTSSALGEATRGMRSIRPWTCSGSKYMSRPWAVISRPREGSTSSIQAVVERRSRRACAGVRARGSSSARTASDLGQVDGEPAGAPVVHPPELGLEPLAERDHRAVRVRRRGSGAPRRRRCARAGPATAPPRRPEALLEREVDPLEQLDRLGSSSTVSGRGGPRRRPHVEGPEGRLGNALKLHAPPKRS